MFDKRVFFLGLLFFSLNALAQTVEAKPDLKFDVDTADFGTVSDGDSVIYEFWFTNVGTADLIIKQAWPACGCTHPTYTHGAIKPGERGYVRVVFHSKGFAGHDMVKEVIIISNGPERYARFKVKVVNAEFQKEVEEYKKKMESQANSDTKMTRKEKRQKRKEERKKKKEKKAE